MRKILEFDVSFVNYNPPAFSNIGTLNNTKNNELVFVYPIIIDERLENNWRNLVRDFVALQFINQIKISNIINIKSKAQEERVFKNYISPAEIMANTLAAGNQNDAFYRYQTAYTNIRYFQAELNQREQSSQLHPKDIEEKLRQKYEFIKTQLKSDPRYSDLSPVFDLVTVEHNLIEIPLILGTKIFKVSGSGLYWILFLSLACNLPLNNSNNINNISQYINYIPKERFLELLNDPQSVMRPNIPVADDVYNRLKLEIKDKLQKTAEKFNKIAGSLNSLEAEVGISMNFKDNGSMTISYLISRTNKLEFKSKVNSLVQKMVVSSVFPFIQSVNNLIVNPATGINFTDKYKKLVEDIRKSSDILSDSVLNAVAGFFSKPDSHLEFVNTFKNICNNLNTLNPNNEISMLGTLSLRFADIRNQASLGNNTPVINLAEDINKISYTLSSKVSTISNYISSFTSTIMNFENVNNNAINTLTINVNDFFSGIYSSHNFRNTLFSRLFYGSTVNHLDIFMNNTIKTIVIIFDFCILFSIIGYLCELLNQVSLEYKLNESSIISFPNYTLVIPLDYIRNLYYAISIKNIKAVEDNRLRLEFEKFKLGERDVFNIVKITTERLSIPNFMVIDDKTSSVFYKFCYLPNVIKMNKESMVNYIKMNENK